MTLAGLGLARGVGAEIVKGNGVRCSCCSGLENKTHDGGSLEEAAEQGNFVQISQTEQKTGTRISQKGLDLITGYEGFEPKPYRCQAEKLTIGYGHVIQPGETFTSITEQEAKELFRKDLTKYENAVADNVKVAIDQNQYDALVSLAYNIGPEAIKNSTLIEELNKGNYAGAANEFPKWNKVTIKGKKVPSEGLTNRRIGEQNRFNGGRK